MSVTSTAAPRKGSIGLRISSARSNGFFRSMLVSGGVGGLALPAYTGGQRYCFAHPMSSNALVMTAWITAGFWVAAFVTFFLTSETNAAFCAIEGRCEANSRTAIFKTSSSAASSALSIFDSITLFSIGGGVGRYLQAYTGARQPQIEKYGHDLARAVSYGPGAKRSESKFHHAASLTGRAAANYVREGRT